MEEVDIDLLDVLWETWIDIFVGVGLDGYFSLRVWLVDCFSNTLY